MLWVCVCKHWEGEGEQESHWEGESEMSTLRGRGTCTASFIPRASARLRAVLPLLSFVSRETRPVLICHHTSLRRRQRIGEWAWDRSWGLEFPWFHHNKHSAECWWECECVCVFNSQCQGAVFIGRERKAHWTRGSKRENQRMSMRLDLGLQEGDSKNARGRMQGECKREGGRGTLRENQRQREAEAEAEREHTETDNREMTMRESENKYENRSWSWVPLIPWDDNERESENEYEKSLSWVPLIWS